MRISLKANLLFVVAITFFLMVVRWLMPFYVPLTNAEQKAIDLIKDDYVQAIVEDWGWMGIRIAILVNVNSENPVDDVLKFRDELEMLRHFDLHANGTKIKEVDLVRIRAIGNLRRAYVDDTPAAGEQDKVSTQ